MEIETKTQTENPNNNKKNDLCVKVALRVRPLQPKEIMEGAHCCIEVNKDKNEVNPMCYVVILLRSSWARKEVLSLIKFLMMRLHKRKSTNNAPKT